MATAVSASKRGCVHHIYDAGTHVKTIEIMTSRENAAELRVPRCIVCTGGMDLECNLERLPDVFYPLYVSPCRKAASQTGSPMPCPSESKSSSQLTHSCTQDVSLPLPNNQSPCPNSTNDIHSPFSTTGNPRPRLEEQQSPHPQLSPEAQNEGPKPQPPLGAVEVAKVAVPPDADDVDEEHAVLEGHDLEVDGLGEGPEHVVGRQGGLVVLVELVLDRVALHRRHGAQEHADEHGREDALVQGHARQDRAVGGL